MRFKNEKLINLRKILGLTQKDVQNLTGVKEAHISQIEAGRKNPRPDTVEKLAKGLKVSDNYFYLDEYTLPVYLLPEMPLDVSKFVFDHENIPWIELALKAKNNGLTLEQLSALLDIQKIFNR